MMKLLCKLFLFTMILATFQSCIDDNIPRNRPVLELNNVDADDVVDEEEEEEEELEESRPSGAIIIQSGHCACSEGKQVSIGNCESFCAAKGGEEGTTTLYFDVELTDALTLDVYEDVFGWCSIQEGEEIQKQCALEAKDEDGNIQNIDFTPAAGQTSFAINVNGLNEDETYRVSIKETSTGATSTPVQLRLISEIITDDVGGPLALMPVNQYTCIFREGGLDTTSGELFNDSISQFHFYFISATRPEPLQENALPTVACYDFQTYGTSPINSPLLEEQTGSFTVWNRNDPRFYSLDGSDRMKVDELIEQSLVLQGQSTTAPTLFYELSWMNGIDDGDSNPGDDSDVIELTTTTKVLGMYMTPFLDRENGYKAYCPTQEHYYSDNPLFKALREIVAIDTEGLYAAKQDNACDYIMIRESLLKQIWFYVEDGVHIQPTDETVRDKKIQFYWPANTSSPYIKKSHQKIYTVKASDEIASGNTPEVESGSSDSGGVRTSLPPHDRRIGCIPKLVD